MNELLAQSIKSEFKKHFNKDPILVFSPGRINLIGEHTDYNKGFVLPAAIDKGIIAGIEKSETKMSSIVSIDLNERYDFSLDTITPLNNGNWKNYVIGIVGELQKSGKHIENFNLVFGGDIPRGAGLSSSAALENSIVFALNELFDLGLSKIEMIYISQKAEHNYVGVKCGIMDQYASMFGQENTAILLDCQNLKATETKLNLKEYSLLLINTNVNHQLSESAYNDRRSTCEKIAARLGKESLRDITLDDLKLINDSESRADMKTVRYVLQENQRVLEAYNAIIEYDIPKLGKLLFASHDGLKNQYIVSCNELDFLVDNAKASDAVIGSRMMGGGFGGCTINIIKKSKIEAFKEQVSKEYRREFDLKCTFHIVKLSEGTKLMHS